MPRKDGGSFYPKKSKERALQEYNVSAPEALKYKELWTFIEKDDKQTAMAMI